MNSNMQLALTLMLKGQQSVGSGLRNVKTSLGGIGNAARGATAELKRLHDQINGFSTATKLAGLVGGAAVLRDVENVVLSFQRAQLELKQTAQLSKEQVAEISSYAKESAAAMLQTPSAIIEGAVALANAGEKWQDLLPTLRQATQDAAAFRATVKDMANMDFDIKAKMAIRPEELSQANNMLLYHARAGRFEASAMSSGAPELFTYAQKVGLTGMSGLNLVGAMTQQVMKGVAPSQQGKVLTDFEQGFSHIVTPHYMKGLSKAGIDVEKYMPHGKFYGEGGVQGFTDLVRAMKAKGLEDPFKMARAGFADKETKDFWYQMMRGVDSFEGSVREAAAAAKSAQTQKDREEIAGSAVGQDAQARAKYESRQLDMDSGVSVWERLKNKAAENPMTSMLSAIGVGAVARTAWKNRQAKNAASKTALQASNSLRPQNVFVMNWPKSLGVAGTLNGNAPLDLPGKDAPAGKESKAAKFGRYAVYSAAAASELAAVGYASYQVTSALMETQTGEKFSGWLADQAALIMAALGNTQAQEIVTNLHLDGEQIATVVNRRNSENARRH